MTTLLLPTLYECKYVCSSKYHCESSLPKIVRKTRALHMHATVFALLHHFVWSSTCSCLLLLAVQTRQTYRFKLCTQLPFSAGEVGGGGPRSERFSPFCVPVGLGPVLQLLLHLAKSFALLVCTPVARKSARPQQIKKGACARALVQTRRSASLQRRITGVRDVAAKLDDDVEGECNFVTSCESHTTSIVKSCTNVTNAIFFCIYNPL